MTNVTYLMNRAVTMGVASPAGSGTQGRQGRLTAAFFMIVGRQ
jgi:hypothetical protein